MLCFDTDIDIPTIANILQTTSSTVHGTNYVNYSHDPTPIRGASDHYLRFSFC